MIVTSIGLFYESTKKEKVYLSTLHFTSVDIIGYKIVRCLSFTNDAKATPITYEVYIPANTRTFVMKLTFTVNILTPCLLLRQTH